MAISNFLKQKAAESRKRQEEYTNLFSQPTTSRATVRTNTQPLPRRDAGQVVTDTLKLYYGDNYARYAPAVEQQAAKAREMQKAGDFRYSVNDFTAGLSSTSRTTDILPALTQARRQAERLTPSWAFSQGANVPKANEAVAKAREQVKTLEGYYGSALGREQRYNTSNIPGKRLEIARDYEGEYNRMSSEDKALYRAEYHAQSGNYDKTRESVKQSKDMLSDALKTKKKDVKLWERVLNEIEGSYGRQQFKERSIEQMAQDKSFAFTGKRLGYAEVKRELDKARQEEQKAQQRIEQSKTLMTQAYYGKKDKEVNALVEGARKDKEFWSRAKEGKSNKALRIKLKDEYEEDYTTGRGMVSTPNLMSEEEKATLYYYYATDKDKYRQLYDMLGEKYRGEKADINDEYYKYYGAKHPLMSTGYRAVMGPTSGLTSALNTASYAAKDALGIDYAPDIENDPNYAGSRIRSALGEGVTKAAEEAGAKTFGDNKAVRNISSFLAQTGLSIADMAAVLPMGPASLYMMATTAAGDSMYSAVESGASPTQALIKGSIDGAVEYFTEKLPIENLLKAFKEPTKSIRRTVVKQILTEAGEEYIAKHANQITDILVMGEMSDYNRLLRGYKEQGMDESEARHKALMQSFVINPLLSAVGGAISGGVMGTGAAALGRAMSSEGRSGGSVTINTDTPVDVEVRDFMHKVSNRAEINIVVEDIQDTQGRKMSAAEGYYDRASNTMVFAPEATKADVIKGVVMHELTHSIEGSKFYGEYRDFVVRELYGNDTMAYMADINKKIAKYKGSDISLDTDGAERELVAEFTRNKLFNDEAAIDRLVSQKPNLAVRVYESVRDAIERVKAYFKDGEEQDKQSEEYKQLQSLEAGRKLFERALDKRGVDRSVFKNAEKNTRQMAVKDDAINYSNYEQKFITDNNGKVHIRDVETITDSEWNQIAKGFRQLGYDIRGAEDAKKLFYRYTEASFNDDQVTKLKQIFGGEVEQPDKKINKERATKAARHFGLTTDFREAGYILHNGDMLDFSGKKEGGPTGQRAMDHREISPIFDDEIGDGYSEYMVRFMSEGNIRMSAGTGVDIGPIEPTQKQYATLRKFVDFQMSKNDFFALDLSSEKGYTLESREYDEGTPTSKIINDIKAYFKTGELPTVSDVQKFRYSIKDDASTAGADPDTTADAKREWAEKGTDSKYFKKWFGDSKVVDKQGKPLVVYHGSNEWFNVFEKSKIGTGEGSALGEGFYFTTNEEVAYAYGGRVAETYLSVKNPYIVGKSDLPSAEVILEQFLPNKWGEHKDVGVSYIKGKLRSEMGTLDLIKMIAEENNTTTSDTFRQLGFDGVRDGHEIVVFEPTQIKSATDNVGTFDDGNADIQYSIKKGGEGKTPSATDKLASSLIKEYESDYDIDVLNEELSNLFKEMKATLFLKNGTYTQEELNYKMREIADNILKHSTIMEGDTKTDDVKEMLSWFRTTKISLSDADRGDIADYNDFRKRYFGKIRLVKNGLPVDTFYKELAERWPGVFDEEKHSTPSDQLQHIAEVIDSFKPTGKNMFYGDTTEQINVIRKIFNSFIASKPHLGTKGPAKTTETLEEANKKISQFYSNTIKRAKAIPQKVKDGLTPESFDFIPESSKEWQALAEKNVNADMKGTIKRLEDAPSISGGIEAHEAAVIAKKLVDKFKKSGSEEDFKVMQDFLKTVAAKTRESARALKATDTAWDKTDPAAAVIRAERTVQKVTEAEKKVNPRKYTDGETEQKMLGARMKNAEQEAKKAAQGKELTPEQLKEAEAARKKKILENWVKDTVPRGKQKTMMDKIMEMHEAGAYNDAALARLVSEKRGIPYLDTQEVKTIIEHIEKANKAKEGSYEQRMELARADAIVESKLPVSFRDKIKAFPRISILTGTRTQVRNIVGNVIHGTYEAARENTVGLITDIIASKATGQRQISGNVLGKSAAYWKGFGTGISEWYSDIKNGVDTAPTKTRGEIKRNTRTFKSAFLNAIDAVVKQGLTLGDRPFYQGAYEARFYELSRLNKKNGGKKTAGEIAIEAQLYALDKVFQNDSTVKNVASRVRNLPSAIENPFWQGAAEVGMTLTMPFTETPANIFDKALENSPMGLAKAALELGKTKKGTFDQLKFVQNLSRGLTGTGLMVLGAMLFKKGLISIEPWDEDYDKYKFMQSIGLQNYALKIGNKNYSLNWIEPIATPLLAGAEMARGSKDNEDILDTLFGTVKIGIDSFFEASFVQGLSELFESGSVGEGVKRKLLDSPDMFIPLSAFSKSLAQFVDPYIRETRDDSDLRQMLKEKLATIPFASKRLPVRVDAFGNEAMVMDGKNTVFNVFFNPANVTEYKTTAVHDEIIKLYDETNSVIMFPDYISKTEVKYRQESKGLNDKQFEAYKKKIGGRTYEEYEKVMATDAYKKMTPEEKMEALAAAKAAVKNQVNFETVRDNADTMTKLLSETGVYNAKTQIALDKAYANRWAELTPDDDNAVFRANSLSSISEAVNAFGKEGKLNEKNAAKIMDYINNKKPLTLTEQEMVKLYRETGSRAVFNNSYDELLKFTLDKKERVINIPEDKLPDIIAESDKLVVKAYASVVKKGNWKYLNADDKLSALSKAKRGVRQAYEDYLKEKYGYKLKK